MFMWSLNALTRQLIWYNCLQTSPMTNWSSTCLRICFKTSSGNSRRDCERNRTNRLEKNLSKFRERFCFNVTFDRQKVTFVYCIRFQSFLERDSLPSELWKNVHKFNESHFESHKLHFRIIHSFLILLCILLVQNTLLWVITSLILVLHEMMKFAIFEIQSFWSNFQAKLTVILPFSELFVTSDEWKQPISPLLSHSLLMLIKNTHWSEDSSRLV
jgi:hypothetical protein